MDNNQMSGDQGSSTGTRDVTYDLTAVLYHALQGAENCQTYMGDAQGRQEHRQFFQQALQAQKQLAEQAKQLLHDSLMQETGGGSSSGSIGQQGSSMGGGAMAGGMASTQTHSFDEARDDGSAFRFASGQTEGGSDQFEGGSEQDRQGGSALTSGQQVGGTHNDPSSGQFGQSALGQGQRHNEMTTGGGGTSSF